MKISVQLFAAAKEAVGYSPLELNIADNACIADLRDAIVNQATGLLPMSDNLLFAVNNQYAGDDCLLQPNDKVACFPPVSGG